MQFSASLSQGRLQALHAVVRALALMVDLNICILYIYMLTCWLSDQRSENLLCSMDSQSSLIRISLNEVPAYVCRSHSHHRFLVHVPSLYHAKARLGLNSASTVSSTWESSRLLEGPALPWNLRPPFLVPMSISVICGRNVQSY